MAPFRWIGRAIMGANMDVVSLDIDVVLNRISMGVIAGHEDAVLAASLLAGIPAAALHVFADEPPHALTSLQDRYRPVTPGFQIEAPWIGACTAGMNGYHNGLRVLVVASHCTTVSFSPDAEPIYQNLEIAGRRIGFEIADRDDYWCYPNFPYECRWSDAAYVQYTDTVQSRSSAIAKPDRINSYTSPTDIVLNVTGTNAFPVVGEHLSSDIEISTAYDKVGRTTGWSRASITHDCYDVRSGEPPYPHLLCQFRGRKALFRPGDSGAPVFWRHLLTNEVHFAGIAWGGGGSGEDSYMIFSPPDGIRADLGGF